LRARWPDLFSNLALGFHVVFQFTPWSPQWPRGGFSIPIPINILLCLIGPRWSERWSACCRASGTIATVAMLL